VKACWEFPPSWYPAILFSVSSRFDIDGIVVIDQMRYISMRKWTIGVLFFAAILSGGNLYGADGALTCANWNTENRSSNVSLVWGWLEGLQAALALSATTTDQDNDVVSMLWPTGHRVGSVVVEMDVECKRTINRNQTLQQSLKNIAFRINNRTN
jgi:hypothetical protein